MGRVLTLFAAVSLPLSAHAGEYSKLSGSELGEFVRQDCGSCHGMTLAGGLGRPLTKDSLAAWDIEALTRIVLDGVPGTAMPPWAEILTPEQANWIARGLKEGTLQ